mgnify:FL=1
MNRRHFFTKAGLLSYGAHLTANHLLANAGVASDAKILKGHRIDKVKFLSAKYHYPRFVGRNSQLKPNGQHKKDSCVRLYTDQGAVGWGRTRAGREQNKIEKSLIGKTVDQLIVPSIGTRAGVHPAVDLALHDLAGVILEKPVYQMLGAKGSKATDLYSGMIYFDELDAEGKSVGIDKVIQNCQWDYDYGYRKVKVKIGRSSRWYPHDKGLAKDIEVVNKIHETFGKKGLGILVDANDGYSLQDTIDFFEGVNDVPIYWFEEPFREDAQTSRKLKQWMLKNGREKTFYADGEKDPDLELVRELIADGTLDMHLVDIQGYGFTKWRRLIPFLRKHKAMASPHTWGSMLKTHYVSHLAAGLESTAIIEGVTCLSDDIDYGDYKIIDGKLIVSDAPGFGMKLRI